MIARDMHICGIFWSSARAKCFDAQVRNAVFTLKIEVGDFIRDSQYKNETFL
jgi:hypothetical protein